MRYEIGERVRCDESTGTIVEAIRQRNVGDLFRIAWDNDPDDHELYQDVLLTSLSQDDTPMRWAA